VYEERIIHCNPTQAGSHFTWYLAEHLAESPVAASPNGAENVLLNIHQNSSSHRRALQWFLQRHHFGSGFSTDEE
jgi:hypothetical protein